MFDIFKSVKDFIKLDKICIDNNAFRLHYKASFVILVVFSLLVTSKQYIGDPIDCIVNEIPQNVMDTYCWIYSTFTIPNLQGTIGETILQPGVASYDKEKDKIKYHKYYQWVCFALFFQAILFYIPRYFWKSWEGGKLKMLCQDLNLSILTTEEKRLERISLIADYLILNLHQQNFYAYQFFFCEFLNLFNVVSQIYLVDYFLDGEFSTYGADVIWFTEMDQNNRIDPMCRVFPKLTKCTFNKYGPSGSIEHFDGLCVLPINIVNEKIYVFLWFWFIFLAAVSVICLVYHFAVASAPSLQKVLLRAKSRMSSKTQIRLICDRCSIGDWFVLYQLGKNIDPIIFHQLINTLVDKFEGKQGGV